ncbi:uncharacterized protein LOC130712657 [Lotus japonicus]|uniref:uncharacterized protein LOC130712657 n=1 Tax=Lotus japonicus TaxID=34305 RepID=UPI0025888946|nr:uncharacterized protein LOC130712657 [Lotus japonicus]
MGEMEVIELDHDFYIIQFSNMADYAHIFNGGPWVIMGHYLIIQQWQPGFFPEEGVPGKVAVWVRIPKFPVEMYGKRFLWRIGNHLGQMIRIDEHTLKIAKDGGQSTVGNERCKFARICVEVDLRKALVAKFNMNDQVYKVEYEGLNLICFHCGRFGHRHEIFPLSTLPQGVEAAQGERPVAQSQAPAAAAEDSQSFGDWMIVKREKRKGGVMAKSKGGGVNAQAVPYLNTNYNKKGGSRFNALHNHGETSNEAGAGSLEENVEIIAINDDAIKGADPKAYHGLFFEKTMPIIANNERSSQNKGNIPSAAGPEVNAAIPSNVDQVVVNPNLTAEARGDSSKVAAGVNHNNTRPIHHAAARGAGAKGFPLLLKDLIRRHSISCIALFETRVSGVRARSIIRKLDFQGVHVEEAVGFSGGIWLRWDTNVLTIDVLSSHRQFVHTKVSFLEDHQQALATFVYGSPQPSMRDYLWESLVSIVSAQDIPWIVIGDFNAYQEASDKFGGAGLNLHSMQRFNSCLLSCGLSDMGFKGPPFTWEGRGVKERIDRGVCNPQWVHTFPESVVLHLPQLKSDHKPLLLAVSGIVEHRAFSRPFRFQAGWLTHDDFPRLMNTSWDPAGGWLENASNFRDATTTWNDDVFGQIFHRKRRLMKRLEGINNRLSMTFDRGLEKLQKTLWQEYNTVLLQEELFCAQKSRFLWFKFGDRNSKFFHTATLIRRKRNKIEALIDDDGNLLTDFDDLQVFTVNFFRRSYMDDGGGSSLATSSTFPSMAAGKLALVQSTILAAEVKDAIFSMGPLKAPGPDGLQAAFFQSQWAQVGDSVTSFVLKCFEDPSLVSKVNDTLLVLIPKVDAPDRISQFRPISLCNVIYKTVTKIITNRLRRIMGELVAPNQCSFVPGRHSSDNIVIAQEVFHSMRFLKRRLGWLAIKVDLEKAYDRLKWSFLLETLQLIGLNDHLCTVIMSCVSSYRFQVLFNGGRSSSFSPQRGLRQGDPLSPYLFVLCMERLAHSIGDAVSSGAWKPIKLSRNGPPISHLFFADDLLLFGEATVAQMECVMGCLNGFCSASGMKVSIPKTRLMVSKNVGAVVTKELSDISAIGLTSDLGRYLGVPLAHQRVKASSYQYILDRTQKRLSSWRSQMLNFAGRVTLAKSVIPALPTYSMQTSLLPKEVCGKLEKIQRDFIWGTGDMTHGAHSIAWPKLCCSKQDGGLGLRRMYDFNKSLVMKLGWGLVSNPDALWARVLRDKYSCGSDAIPTVQRKSSESHVWRAIRSTWPDLEGNLRWRIGDGNTVRFWYDKWVFSGTVLINHALVDIPAAEAVRTVADYYDHMQGRWKISDLSFLLPGVVLAEVIAMPPPSLSIGSDQVCWGLTSDGLFSSRSAYEASGAARVHHQQLDWRKLWRWKGPYKITHFLWRLANDGLWVNHKRWQSRMTGSASCPLCGDCDETGIHLFRGCLHVKPLWLQVADHACFPRFFHLNLPEWIHGYLDASFCTPGASGTLDFGFLLWAIWKARADVVFNGAGFNLRQIVESAARFQVELTASESDVEQLLRQSATSRPSPAATVTWHPPSELWFKFNVDGSVCQATSAAGCGGVCRDSNGQWVFGFSRNLGLSNVFWSELWGIFTALHMSLARGLGKVIVESDSLAAITLVNGGCERTHPYASLVLQIRELMQKDWEVICRHTLREANQVADCLANMAHSLALGHHVYDAPHPRCRDLLFFDVMGVAYPRQFRS